MKYWNPYLETLPRETLCKIELSHFRNILSHAKTHSVLYQQKLKASSRTTSQHSTTSNKSP